MSILPLPDPERQRLPVVITLAGIIAVAACGGDAASEAAPDTAVERITRGDTMIVRNHGLTGAWGDTMTLQVDLLIGARDGPPELSFGDIGPMAVDPGGSILVADQQAAVIRRFDEEGEFAGTVGQKGEGPGELQRPAALAALPDGQILVLDQTRKINAYAADGSFLTSWTLERATSTYQLPVDTAGLVYVPVRLIDPTVPRQPGSPIPVAFRRYTAEGSEAGVVPGAGWIPDAIDQVPLTYVAADHWKENFVVRNLFAVHPTGRLIRGRTDAYRFDMVRPEHASDDSLSTSTPGVLRIERVVEAPLISDDEYSEWRAYIDYTMEGRRAIMERLPAGVVAPPVREPHLPEDGRKPFYRQIHVADDGRVWLHRYTPSIRESDPSPPQNPSAPVITWREPNHFDVFEADGEFLGTVVVPDRYLIRAMRGQTVWGVYHDELDVEFAFRAQLVPAGGVATAGGPTG